MYASQLSTILWLRWRLTRNQWSRGGRVNAVLTLIVTILLVFVGAFGGLAGLLVGWLLLAQAGPTALLGVGDAVVGAFLFFWLIGVLAEIQRSEAIDIGKLLHLPISLRGIFVVNYLASHLTPSVVLFVPWMVGLTVGLALGRGWAMLGLLPLSLGFLFSVTAWTYYVRGWLVAMLTRNPRRYRAIVAGITIAFILLSQLPNYVGMFADKQIKRVEHAKGQSSSQTPVAEVAQPGIPPLVLRLHNAIPPLWVGNGAMALAAGNAWPAVWGTGGALAIGALGLGCAYRATRRFYEGRDIRARRKRRRAKAAAAAPATTFLERSLPGVPEEAAGLALATLRSMLRATEVKMMLASGIPIALVFGGMMLFSKHEAATGNVPMFYATGAALFPYLGLMQLLGNQFGLDRTGFRVLVLSPMPRWQILLGKNLALLPFLTGLGAICLAVAALALHLPPVDLLAACLQFFCAFLLLSMAGNLVSVLMPFRFAPGSLKPTKVPATTVVVRMLAYMLFPTLAAPILLPATLASLLSFLARVPAAPINLLASAAELAILIMLYRLSLPRLGALLQRREKKVLEAVTQEVE
jgi:ABC-2 type transport system permease protein